MAATARRHLAALIGMAMLAPTAALAGSTPPPGMAPDAANARLPTALASLYQRVNAKAYGAKGDGVTDDSAAIASAIAAVEPKGGVVLFPPGAYCVFSGVTVAGDDVRLLGSGGYSGYASVIEACGHDVTVVALNGNRDSIGYLNVSGMDSPAATHPTVTSAGVDSSIEHAFLDSGYDEVYNTGAELILAYDFIGFSYGPANVFSTGALHVRKVKADTPYPYGSPAVAATISAWTANTLIAAGALRTIASGTWLLQATVGGTTGTAQPTAASYASDIADGTVTWQLAGRVNNYAFQLDSVGASGSDFVENDMTGPYYWVVGLTNTTGTAGTGNGPQAVRFAGDNFGDGLNGHIYADDGAGLVIAGATFSNCILSGCAHLRTTGSWAGVASVTGGVMHSGSYGVDNDAAEPDRVRRADSRHVERSTAFGGRPEQLLLSGQRPLDRHAVGQQRRRGFDRCRRQQQLRHHGQRHQRHHDRHQRQRHRRQQDRIGEQLSRPKGSPQPRRSVTAGRLTATPAGGCDKEVT